MTYDEIPDPTMFDRFVANIAESVRLAMTLPKGTKRIVATVEDIQVDMIEHCEQMLAKVYVEKMGVHPDVAPTIALAYIRSIQALVRHDPRICFLQRI